MPKHLWQRGLALTKQRFERGRHVPKQNLGSKLHVPGSRPERDQNMLKQHMEPDCDVSRLSIDGGYNISMQPSGRDVWIQPS